MKKFYLCVPILLMVICFTNCNPDCQSVNGLAISTPGNPVGYQVLLTANPLSSLKGRRVFFGKTEANKVEYKEDVGLLVTVPQGVSGKTDLRVEDPDCADFVSLDFNVFDKDYFLKNPDYIFPIVPEIIIPSGIAPFPPSIDRMWNSVSATQSDYFIWFISLKDTIRRADNSIEKIVSRITLDDKNSSERSKCNDPKIGTPNPVYGIYDSVNRYLHFWIDRTKKGAGIEEFTGEFIDMKNTNYNTTSFKFPCDNNTVFTKKGYMLLITSVKTGRQLVLTQVNF